MTSTRMDVEPSPVFVDQTGRRGRRLRGLGWVIGIVCVGFAVAMISGLLGTESQAPAFAVPATADTTPPSQYVDAPLPSPPAGTEPRTRTPAAGPTAAATRPAGPRTATRPGTAGTAPRTGTAAGTTARTAAGTTAGTTARTTSGTAGTAGAAGAAPRPKTALPTRTP